MPEFSANIGFLWPELDLPGRIRAAAAAGFAAVECHFPYATPADDVLGALQDTGLGMVGLNTVLGARGKQDFGIAARPERMDEARAAIDQAIAYARVIDCANVNVVPGRTGRSPGSEAAFRENLRYACHQADDSGVGILVEPVNTRSAPDFHLSTVEQAIETIEAVACSNIRLMFDCYHVQIMQGDLLARFANALPLIGHVQISAIHDRGEPDQGEIDFGFLLPAFDDLGWKGYIGAEYQPRTTTDAGLGWMQPYRDAARTDRSTNPSSQKAGT